MKEVQLKRYAGPFDKIPFENYVQSPIGLVPKAGNQTRLIFHLSYQFKKSGNQAVNQCTLKHFCRVKYNNLDHTVENSIRLLKPSPEQGHNQGQPKVIWYGKTDVKSAFRVLPLKPTVYWLLVMTA